MQKECHLEISSHNTDGDTQTQLSLKDSADSKHFSLTMQHWQTSPLQSIANTNQYSQHEPIKFNGKLFSGHLGPPSKHYMCCSLSVFIVLPPFPHQPRRSVPRYKKRSPHKGLLNPEQSPRLLLLYTSAHTA